MPLMVDIRRRAKLMLGPLLGACIAIYFGYHLLNGERSVVALIQLDHQITEARDELARISGVRSVLERRAALLRPGHLDADMLEEQARRLLNVGREGDMIVLTAPQNAPAAVPARVPDAQPALHRPVTRN